MRAGEIYHALSELCVALVARILVTPLALLIPRDPAFWIVMGREHGKFLDNAKYFFCWMHRNIPDGHRATFLTEHEDVVHLLRTHHACVLRYPRPGAMWALLRAGTIVIDTVDQIEHGRVALMFGARIVQLWHGAPLKEIELPLHARRLATLTPIKHAILSLQKSVTGRYLLCNYLVATSKYFAKHAFSKCFHAQHIIATGYPRNDVILSSQQDTEGLTLANVDMPALERIRTERAMGRRVVLYAPTFRKDRSSPFVEGKVDLKRWSEAASRHNFLIVLKLHPLMLGQYEARTLKLIVDVSADSDIYPLLGDVDLMITDYSSIFFDYLLIDRPILFFAYDLEHYVTQDRHLLFDYDVMTPGPKLSCFDDLLASIPQNLDDADAWAEERHHVRTLVFDDIDAFASERIWRTLNACPIEKSRQ